jgi:hypothetical protein
MRFARKIELSSEDQALPSGASGGAFAHRSVSGRGASESRDRVATRHHGGKGGSLEKPFPDRRQRRSGQRRSPTGVHTNCYRSAGDVDRKADHLEQTRQRYTPSTGLTIHTRKRSKDRSRRANWRISWFSWTIYRGRERQVKDIGIVRTVVGGATVYKA